MEPLFFGTNKRLYGVLHTPPQGNCDRAILICPPIGQEYLRLHRSLVWLGNMFSQQGIGVLRFDYRGTGDSVGELTDVALDDWLEDTQEAITEIKEQFGNVELSVIGIRLGALIATHCGSDQPIERMLAWEACASGTDYFDELKDDIARKNLPARNFQSAEGAVHHNGFVYSQKLQDSLRKVDITEDVVARLTTKELLLLNRSSIDCALPDNQLGNIVVSNHDCEVDFSWLDVDVIGSSIIPFNALGTMVKLLS